MYNQPKSFLLLICIFVFQLAKGQITNFEIGYKDGFKFGYCYNVKTISCFYPIQFMAPQPRLNESYTSYQDGYNRGFQVGIDLQRVENDSKSDNDYYQNLSKQIPTYKSNDYIPPMDLDLLMSVNLRKQKLFDSRLDWLRERVRNIRDLNFVALSSISPVEHKSIDDYMDNNFRTMDVDLSDNNIFNQIVSKLNNLEQRIRSTYDKENQKTNSEINSLIIPTNFSNKTSKYNCSFIVNNSKNISYSFVDIGGKELANRDFTTFQIENSQGTKYFTYSKIDKSYFYTSNQFVDDEKKANLKQKMTFLFATESFFVRENGSWEIIGEGKIRIMNNDIKFLGTESHQLSDGTVLKYKMYQEKNTSKKYFIPDSLFYEGELNREYPIFSSY